MTKAFDLISHKTLLYKLERYGIRGQALSWLTSYLSNRKQCVEVSQAQGQYINSYRSSFRTQNAYGVPQGSVLGPLLFLLYINDLPNFIHHKCIIYADDTTVIIKTKDKHALENEVNQTIASVIEWLNYNNLSINMSKTHYIQFQTFNSHPPSLNIVYDSYNIRENDTASFLGITIDKLCNWKAHVDILCQKIDKFVYVLKRLTEVVNKKTALLAYHGYVSSILRYGLVLWGNSTDALRVFIKQKACLRSICRAGPLDSCKPLFKANNILPLPCLYIYEMLLFVKKHPSLFPTYPNRRGRSQNKLWVPPRKLALFAKNSFCMAITLFNKLPECHKTLPLVKFKRVIFTILLKKNYYNISEYLNDNQIST